MNMNDLMNKLTNFKIMSVNPSPLKISNMPLKIVMDPGVREESVTVTDIERVIIHNGEVIIYMR